MAPLSLRLPWGDRFGIPCLDSPLAVRTFPDPYGREVRVEFYPVEANFKHCSSASISTAPVIYRENALIGSGWRFARQEFGQLFARDQRWLAFFDHCDRGKPLHSLTMVRGHSSRLCLSSR
jgi:hypothetical protein